MNVRPLTRLLALAACACVAQAAALAPSASAALPPFEITSFDGGAFKQNGELETLAGAHPWSAEGAFRLNRVLGLPGVGDSPGGTLRDAIADLPAGFVGNPRAVPSCPSSVSASERCPNNTQIGYAMLLGNPHLPDAVSYFPLYNMEAPPGHPALLRFSVENAPVNIVPRLRSDGDYGVSIVGRNAPQTLNVFGVGVVIWGAPASPLHNSERGFQSAGVAVGSPNCATPTVNPCSNPWTAPPGWGAPTIKPFISLPTSCAGPVDTHIRIETWEGLSDEAFFTSPTHTDCETLQFGPSAESRPSATSTDSASGLDFTLEIPQSEDVNGRATAHLRDSLVTLPEGLTANPSSANGIDGCAESEVGLGDGEAVDCPQASKLGTVSVETPVLEHPLPGAVYLADPYENPFGSLLALYLTVEDERTGIVVKIPGEVRPDPETGRLSARFDDNPQLPFERLSLRFFDGPGGSLATPTTCGAHATTATWTPWSAPQSGPPHPTSDSFSLTGSPAGGCPTTKAERPFAPTLAGGATETVAGEHSRFTLRLTRPDGHQELDRVTVKTPPGFTARLRGIERCSEAALSAAADRRGGEEMQSPSCPASSQVGTTAVGAGAGPSPYYVKTGKVYLAGPYKSAPVSLAFVVPAVAGPFDLGVQVVRTALNVDPTTAQVSAVSDPIPQILQGIPVRIRDVRVEIDRPEFTLNPTNCEPLALEAELSGASGATARLSERFQVDQCARLGFKPRTQIQLFGGITRAKYQGVRAVVRPRPGDSNIAGTVVRFPSSAFVAQEHLQNICTRVQWAADACPANSVYGTAEAVTPLLDEPLKGNVHLRSSSNLLPDLVADLRGPEHLPIRVEVAIKNDSVKGALRNTVTTAPDAPVTYFRLQVFGGKKGLIVNSRNICKGSNAARVSMRAHNGRRSTQSVPVRNAKCGKWRKAQKRKAAKRKKQGIQRKQAQRRG